MAYKLLIVDTEQEGAISIEDIKSTIDLKNYNLNYRTERDVLGFDIKEEIDTLEERKGRAKHDLG